MTGVLVTILTTNLSRPWPPQTPLSRCRVAHASDVTQLHNCTPAYITTAPRVSVGVCCVLACVRLSTTTHTRHTDTTSPCILPQPPFAPR
jgi:hypothetical protein